MMNCCPDCGETLVGDGYTSHIHCPNADESLFLDCFEADANPVYCEFKEDPRPDAINIAFVMIKDKQVQGTSVLPVYRSDTSHVIRRRIVSIQANGFERAMAVFSDGAVWSISFPMSDEDISKKALKLFQSL